MSTSFRWTAPWIALGVLVHPAVIVYTGVLGLLRKLSWKDRILGISIIGNILFVAVLILGWYTATYQGVRPHGPEIIPQIVACKQDVFQFGVAAPNSELERIDPYNLYLVSDSTPKTRFEFSDETMSHLIAITVCDRQGRPWITAGLENKVLIYQRYEKDESTEPGVMFADDNGDGVFDRMLDWENHAGYKRVNELEWAPASKQ